MNEQSNQLPAIRKPGALAVMASRLSVEPGKLLDTLKATCFQGATNEELLALVVVANEYHLNPLLRELYAFPGKKGGIVPMVPIDGWIKVVNRQDNYDGVTFTWDEKDGQLVSCTATMCVKGRSHPVVVTEFLAECKRNTGPWTEMPRRMLRHKSFIQAARLAFGLSGIQDEDEARDVSGVQLAAGKPVFADPPTGFLPAPKTATVVVSDPEDDVPMGDLPAVLDTAPDKVTTEAPKVDAAPVGTTPPAPTPTPQAALADFLEGAGVPFGDFASWLVSTGRDDNGQSYPTMDDVPAAVCQKLQRDSKALSKLVALYGKKS